MKYADDRAHGIALLRRWANQAAADKSPREAHLGLMTAMQALLQEIRLQHEVPGIRYWEHPESGHFFTTAPGERAHGVDIDNCVELARHEFFSRQGLYNGYEDSL